MQASTTESISKQLFLHTDTGYPVLTPHLYLTLTFLNKKGIFFYDIQLSNINSELELFFQVSCRGFYFTL